MRNTPLIKTPEQITNIRESGKYLTELLGILYKACKPGVSLIELELIAEEYLQKHNLRGAFKDYQGYPANICASVNDCVVHGIPDDVVLQQGDLLKVDTGVIYKGGISDSAFSIVIGGDHTNPRAAQLIETTKAALDGGLEFIKPYQTMEKFSKFVFNHMTQSGYSVILPLTGHGVGNMVHEKPYVYNYPHPNTKTTKRVPGMVVALEPITSENSTDYIEDRGNDRNLYTENGDLGAQREYMILITERGYEILSGLTEIPK